ncbi:MAG: histidinol dehydrogenase [Verrucomicrobiota bacterium]|nr:histidinol dehydrogenase [Verrucomicrobiota bacterium]
MRVVRYTDDDFAERLAEITSTSSLFDPLIEERTKAIIEQVKSRGDDALFELTEKFDRALLTPETLTVSAIERFNASLAVPSGLRAAVAAAHKNIASFNKKALRRNWSGHNSHGARVGEKFDPFQRVGIYIPGGTAPLVSTALMTVTLARVAGCQEIVVCSPCTETGALNPGLIFALNAAGATEVYKLGGAQAIAAMALGTKTIRPVQKIFGPGNAYVVAAKRLLFGHVAVDLLPGPSEVLVLADDSANPSFVTADLLAQAEHGSGHERVWLITPSTRLVRAVEKEIPRQIKRLSRADYIARALDANGRILVVKSIDQGVEITNRLAPEHCEIMCKGAGKIAERITTAGAIFLGNFSPTVLGDYVAGPSHELPTGGAGRAFAGLTADQFQRRTSVVEYQAGSLKRAVAAVDEFARIEGLDAHGRSATIRLEKGKR